MTETTPAVQETALLQVQELQQIVATAPDILNQNITSKDKAIEAGKKLIALVKKDGVNDVYDEQLSVLQSKIKKTVDAMNERRKPFTQIVDAVKKQFTSIESELKPIQEEIQGIRNAYATEKMKAKQEADRLAQLKLEKDKEVIEIRKEAELLIAKYFNDCIAKTKASIIDYFNELTLESIADADDILATTSTIFSSRYSNPQSVILTCDAKYTSKEEIDVIVSALLSLDYGFKKKEYAFEIEGVIKEYRDKLPSKKTELEAIAKAGKEEKERLEKEATERKDAEAKRLANEQAERERKAQEEASIKASAETAASLVDASVNISEAPNVKEGYSIKLSSNAGYLLLVQFWFEKEGKTLTFDKFEKFTFDRVKRFCEAYAIKNEEFIQSPLISYEPIYKAK